MLFRSANETYLQVGASPLEQAQAFAVSLQTVGFPAKLGPGPSAQIYRVLVGPLPDPYALAHTRDLLRRAGYDSLVRRYGKENDQ